MTTYTLKHADGQIVETFRLCYAAVQYQKEYYKNFKERLIIEKGEEK